MRRALFAASFVLVPTLAFAHAGPAGHTHDLVSGFAHPIGGLDHLLAMVAVGMLAAQLGGRALWLVPASFVAMMAAAGFAGMAGVHLPLAEAGIVLSIIVLSAVVALRLTMPVAAAMALVAFFAIFVALLFRPSIRKAGGCDEALAIALGAGSLISFACMLMASKVGETAAMRLHATELLLLLGTAIVLLVERPATKLVEAGDLSLQHPQLLDNR